MSTLPPQTPDERLLHLQEALRARKERAKVLHAIGGNPAEVLEVIDLGRHGGGDPVLGRIDVGHLVMSVKGVGHIHGAAILTAAGIDEPDLHLDMLNAGERDALKSALQDHFDNLLRG